MKDDRKLEELIKMSVHVGKRSDYVQAGGGNTSVKFSDGTMAVKASGSRLKDMNKNYGYVAIDGRMMKDYCEHEHKEEDCNQRCIQIAAETRQQLHNEPVARASIEVGFHSILDTYVLHLHPVYVNVFMCAQGGMEKALQFAREREIPAVSVEYVIPGYDLTRKILEAKTRYVHEYGESPQVYFLKNHGIITTAATRTETENLMNQINEGLMAKYNLEIMSSPQIEAYNKGFRSRQNWLRERAKESDIVKAVRHQPIYPDQLVYTENELSIAPEKPKKITISNQGIFYDTNEKEAFALEETMTALFYIQYYIRKLGMVPDVLTAEECAQILGWESEKYRKKIMNNE